MMLLMVLVSSAPMLCVGVWVILQVIREEREAMEGRDDGVDEAYVKWLESAQRADKREWSECV